MSALGKVLCMLALVAVSCRGKDADYPAPVYEEPALPPWEPPAQRQEDPFANLDDMDGDWVVDEEPTGGEDSKDETAPVDPTGGGSSSDSDSDSATAAESTDAKTEPSEEPEGGAEEPVLDGESGADPVTESKDSPPPAPEDSGGASDPE